MDTDPSVFCTQLVPFAAYVPRDRYRQPDMQRQSGIRLQLTGLWSTVMPLVNGKDTRREFKGTQCSQRKPRRSQPVCSLNPRLSNVVVSPMRGVQVQTRRTDERPELRLIDLQVSQNAVARPVDVQSHRTT